MKLYILILYDLFYEKKSGSILKYHFEIISNHKTIHQLVRFNSTGRLNVIDAIQPNWNNPIRQNLNDFPLIEPKLLKFCWIWCLPYWIEDNYSHDNNKEPFHPRTIGIISSNHHKLLLLLLYLIRNQKGLALLCKLIQNQEGFAILCNLISSSS